ncbi:tyrosine-type recombinase/integrase [Subtercola sp. RTI3]|uniref:tyrosine-type recombinase/integrase n=1 Tax=Subtercola sp. RTI3 TaxID=3048639 RepID=UPI002B227FCD|nr:tyrosine-type recombinase/integrase [Subtercola sp. RTI3]MEA9983699.1 tyrosine-type recombinase/integrase [Subtercola sp. RTI3]
MVRQIGPEEALKLIESDSSHDAPTVGERAEKYINGKSGVEPKTIKDYRMFMRLHIGPFMGDLPIDAVSPDRIAAWVNEQVDDGAAAKSIKNRHGFLFAMFEDARESGLIQKNPCQKTGLPESERLEMTFLTPNEFTELLSFIPPKYETLVLTLAGTGMRWSEATALKPVDFDFDNGMVRVSRAWKKSAGKGFYLGAPKTRKSRRSITLPASLIPDLRELAARASEFVFENRNGQPVRQSNFYYDTWQPARRMANGQAAYAERNKNPEWQPATNGVWDRPVSTNPIGKWPRVHDLRHSHAYWLIRDGHPLAVVQQRLGHESIQTTSDTYGHLSPDMLHAAAASVDSVLVGAMPQIEG